jgi:hypothetical protein
VAVKRAIAVATLCAVVVTAVVVVMPMLSVRNSSQMEPSYRPAETYTQLRDRALSLQPGDIGLKLSSGDVQPYGIVLEIGFPEAVATLVSLSTGDASLYYSHGGGVIGGSVHEKVRGAARQFVDSSKRFLPMMSKTVSFPLPEVGMTRFYVLTTDGVLTASARDIDLVKGRSDLSSLYQEGHQVIAELREISEKRQNER